MKSPERRDFVWENILLTVKRRCKKMINNASRCTPEHEVCQDNHKEKLYHQMKTRQLLTNKVFQNGAHNSQELRDFLWHNSLHALKHIPITSLINKDAILIKHASLKKITERNDDITDKHSTYSAVSTSKMAAVTSQSITELVWKNIMLTLKALLRSCHSNKSTV